MISLVNQTTFSNPSHLTSGSFNLIAPSIAGNTLVAVVAIVNGNNSPPPISLKSNNTQSFTNSFGAFETSATSAWVFYLTNAQATTSISFAALGGSPAAEPTMIVYEFSGNSLAFQTHTTTTCKFTSVTSFTPAWGFIVNQNCVCVLAAITSSSITNVSPSPTHTDSVPLITGMDANVTSEVYLNVNPSPTPTFTISPASSICSPGLIISETSSITTTTTAIASNFNPSTLGQAVTFTATINGPGGVGSPTGTVDFNIDGSVVATIGVSPVSTGISSAQFSTSTLSVGTHPVFAVYSGDSNYATSTSPTLNQVVTQVAPPPSPANPEPQGMSTADVIWWHPVLDGTDSEIAAIEGFYSEGAGLNIPWLLALSVSQGNAMTDAIARNAQFFTDSEEGGGGGNESGASEFGGGGSTGGLLVDW